MQVRKLRYSLLITALVAISARQATADDMVRLKRGGSVRGDVKAVSATQVSVARPGGTVQDVLVGEINIIEFEGEHAGLKLARNAISGGQYENALTSLERVEPGKITRPEIKQDVEYYDAFCRAKLALAGSGDVRAAGRTLATFVGGQPTSYHHLEARMLLGDLLVAVGAFPKAEEQYAKVAEAPWPETRLRAQIARGRTLLAQEKYADAQTAFEAVLTEAGSVEGAEGLSLRLGGELGKAECLAGAGQFDEAIKMAEKVIAESQPEDVTLNGRAYVTLGNCYRRKPNAAKDALLAYLHVDVLYFRNGEAHAESLARLSELWSTVGKPERALEAKQMLSQRYPNSRWAQK